MFRYEHLCARGVSKSKKNVVWMDLKSAKIRPKIVQNRGLGGLGMAWGVFGEIWLRISRKIVAQVRPRRGKGALSWSKSGPSWPMLALRWRLGAQLGGLGVDFGSIWRRFGTILPHGSDSKNSEKTSYFTRFFAILGGSGGLLRRLGHWFWLCWLQDRIWERILGVCCDMWAPRWRPRAPR